MRQSVTIALETGDVDRFAGPGNFASYARTVDSRRESSDEKGEGNAKCGNRPASSRRGGKFLKTWQASSTSLRYKRCASGLCCESWTAWQCALAVRSPCKMQRHVKAYGWRCAAARRVHLRPTEAMHTTQSSDWPSTRRAGLPWA